MFIIHSLSLFIALSAAKVTTRSTLSCHDVVIPVSVTANNKVIPTDLSLADLNSSSLNSIDSLPSTIVSGDYKIAGRYCAPTRAVAGRKQTLQILVHGITYTRDYWFGLAPPGTKAGQDAYSWALFAAQQGYPTLSIDRLCNGVSSRPNGLAVCQLPLEAETIHAVIEKARAGAIPGVGTKFTKIVFVGHSYGSTVGNYLSAKYPQDPDALLVTGFSFRLINGEVGAAVNPMLRPAALVQPSKYASDDPFYLIATSQSGTKSIFYSGRFDPDIFAYDYSHRQTVTVGEALTGLLGQQMVKGYKGALFVLNGNEDRIFCESNELNSPLRKPGNCSNGFDPEVHTFYPSVSSFGYYNAPKTGHCLNNHYSASNSFAAAHRFLARVGF